MEKLIGMTDFVLEQSAKINDPEILARTLVQRAKFLKQILNIGMFVPAKFENGEWVVLSEPQHIFSDNPEKEKSKMYQQALKEYQEAKQLILFEGLKVHDKYGRKELYIEDWPVYGGELWVDYDYKAPCKANLIIEDLLRLDKEIFLTESGKQQSGL